MKPCSLCFSSEPSSLLSHFQIQEFTFYPKKSTPKLLSKLNKHLTSACFIEINESRGKLREYQRWQRVAQGVVESNSSFLSALQIINVLLNSMIAQLVSELIVSQHFLRSC